MKGCKMRDKRSTMEKVLIVLQFVSAITVISVGAGRFVVDFYNYLAGLVADNAWMLVVIVSLPAVMVVGVLLYTVVDTLHRVVGISEQVSDTLTQVAELQTLTSKLERYHNATRIFLGALVASAPVDQAELVTRLRVVLDAAESVEDPLSSDGVTDAVVELSRFAGLKIPNDEHDGK